MAITVAVPAGRANGKSHDKRIADRYEAAVHLEQVRQQLREYARYGFTVTRTLRDEVSAAERDYGDATRAVAASDG